MKIYLYLFISILVFACADKAVEEKESKVEETKVKEDQGNEQLEEAHLSTFSGFPNEIEGCSCYFGTDSNAVASENFLFVSSYDSIAFVGLNGKKVFLKMTESTRTTSEFGDTNQDNIYRNDSMRVEISWEYQFKNGYESWWNEGEMHVYLNEELLGSKSFVGECGC